MGDKYGFSNKVLDMSKKSEVMDLMVTVTNGIIAAKNNRV